MQGARMPRLGRRPTSLAERVQELLQAAGDVPDDVAGLAVLGQEEGQLQVRVLLQPHLPPVAACQLVRRVLSHGHHVCDQVLLRKQTWAWETLGARCG